MGLQVLNLLPVALEPQLHVAGDIVDVEGAVAVGQHLAGTVISRHDDITVMGVEDVINVLAGMGAVGLGAHQPDVGVDRCGMAPITGCALQVPQCGGLGSSQVNTGCCCLDGYEQQGEKKQNLLHKKYLLLGVCDLGLKGQRRLQI